MGALVSAMRIAFKEVGCHELADRRLAPLAIERPQSHGLFERHPHARHFRELGADAAPDLQVIERVRNRDRARRTNVSIHGIPVRNN
jgi:hypothetical protein